MPRTPETEPSAFARAVVAKLESTMREQDRNQASLARLTGMSANYLSERFQMRKSFTLTDIDRLGKVLNFTPSDFLCGIEVPASNVSPLRPRGVGGATDDLLNEPYAAGSDRTQADPE